VEKVVDGRADDGMAVVAQDAGQFVGERGLA
jgi:hypothetical protein